LLRRVPPSSNLEEFEKIAAELRAHGHKTGTSVDNLRLYRDTAHAFKDEAPKFLAGYPFSVYSTAKSPENLQKVIQEANSSRPRQKVTATFIRKSLRKWNAEREGRAYTATPIIGKEEILLNRAIREFNNSAKTAIRNVGSAKDYIEPYTDNLSAEQRRSCYTKMLEVAQRAQEAADLLKPEDTAE
jgi:hypothetical protein